MKQKHNLGDYLRKNGNIYEIVPHGVNKSATELCSTFLQETSGECTAVRT